MDAINTTLATAWGGRYIDDFIDRGRVKRVYVQADAPFRMSPEDFNLWSVKNAQGEMVPFGAFATTSWDYGSPRLERYNGVPAMEIQGEAAPGVASGDAMEEIERLVAQLPTGIGMEWTAMSYQERQAGSQTPMLYTLSLLVGFLCLAALYESWSIPTSVLLVAPLGILGAVLFTTFRGYERDVYFQVAMLTTVGLTSKNAILIVEFAKANLQSGMSLIGSIMQAVRDRLRPIIMTSLAFGLGVLPLAIASGAGSGAQRAIGTGVLGGMIVGTFLGVVFIPLFFLVVERIFNPELRKEPLVEGEVETREEAAERRTGAGHQRVRLRLRDARTARATGRPVDPGRVAAPPGHLGRGGRPPAGGRAGRPAGRRHRLARLLRRPAAGGAHWPGAGQQPRPAHRHPQRRAGTRPVPHPAGRPAAVARRQCDPGAHRRRCPGAGPVHRGRGPGGVRTGPVRPRAQPQPGGAAAVPGHGGKPPGRPADPDRRGRQRLAHPGRRPRAAGDRRADPAQLRGVVPPDRAAPRARRGVRAGAQPGPHPGGNRQGGRRPLRRAGRARRERAQPAGRPAGRPGAAARAVPAAGQRAWAAAGGGSGRSPAAPSRRDGRRAPPAVGQCEHRCGARGVLPLDQPHRHGRFGQHGAVGPVRGRDRLLELLPADQPPDLPGRPPPCRLGRGAGRPRLRPGRLRAGHPGRLPRGGRRAGAQLHAGPPARRARGPGGGLGQHAGAVAGALRRRAGELPGADPRAAHPLPGGAVAGAGAARRAGQSSDPLQGAGRRLDRARTVNTNDPGCRARERAEAQRDRILDAARQCFTEHGFHAATIANIAETAQVSAGLIYRYFENKNAIVLAIIDRQLRQSRRNIADLQNGVDADSLVPRVADLWRKDEPNDMDPVLFLEMSAESSRNPEIAEALRHADRISADDFAVWLEAVARAQGARPTQLELRVRGI